MRLTAKFVHLLPIQTGTNQNGDWKKQDIIVETEEQYPKKICIPVWGDKMNTKQLQEGNLLKNDFDIESRELNEKWDTNVKARNIENLSLDKYSQKPLVDIPSTTINRLSCE